MYAKVRMRRGLLALLLAVFVCPVALFAQLPEQMLNAPLPTDPKVKIGKLDNGLTYYIRANAEPKGRAEFYILHNVGAIMENDDQQGLAHFTEHMAFNGTTHFPGKQLINFLEHNGVKFGADVNAFTAHDVTCYNISDVPTARQGLLDSCVMVLADWSGSISMEGSEIDAERGVIMEEYRTRRDANWRARDAMMKELFKGSKYAERDVIGPLDFLKTFKYDKIRNFYHTWYKPELQAIIIVGDFDADAMEARVKRIASQIPKTEKPLVRPEFEVPAHPGLVYSTYTDNEARMARIQIFYTLPAQHKQPKTVGYLRESLADQLAIQMLNARFDEIRQQENAPFVAGFGGKQGIVRTVDNMLLIAIPKPGEIRKALTGIITESQRARQKGFVASELERAKADIIRSVQKAYDEKDKTPNKAYIEECIENFTTGEPMLGIEAEAQVIPVLLQTIGLSEVNKAIEKMMPGKDLFVFISAPESEKSQLPTFGEVDKEFNAIYTSDLPAWVDNVKTEPLIEKLPTPGTVKSEAKGKQFGTQEWRLSNGVKVIVKPTTFKDDEIMMTGWAPGGVSLAADADVYSAQLAGQIVAMSGLGNFDAVEMQKLTAGKRASASADLGSNYAEVDGQCSSKVDELELMLQQVHLLFTAPRFDEKAFNTLMGQLRTVYTNQENDPNTQFSRRLRSAMTDGALRAMPLSLENLDKVNLAKAKELYMQQFANARNFTFVFVGNVNLEQLKNLVNLYLGSLPAGNELKWRDDGVRFPTKPRRVEFPVKMETPKVRYAKVYSADAKYNEKNLLDIEALKHVLDLRYTEEVREKEGGTYGVHSQGFITRLPVSQARMLILFDTDPAKAEKLIPMITSIFEELRTNIRETDVEKAKKHFLKSFGEQVRLNEYWLEVVKEFELTGVDEYTNYEKLVNALNAKSLQKSFEKLFGTANAVEVEMEGIAQ